MIRATHFLEPFARSAGLFSRKCFALPIFRDAKTCVEKVPIHLKGLLEKYRSCGCGSSEGRPLPEKGRSCGSSADANPRSGALEGEPPLTAAGAGCAGLREVQ